MTSSSCADTLDGMQGGWAYIVTNKRGGVLYTGVTSKLPYRSGQHREGLIPGFTKRYNAKILVYFEWHDEIIRAIQREKNIKHWPRAWKIELVESMNPEWKDLYETVNS